MSSKLCNGSHLVGGYISYEHLSGNDYKIYSHIFYDCGSAQQGDVIYVCIESDLLNYNSINEMFYDTTNLFPYHSCLSSASSCFLGGPVWGVSDNVFSCTVTLPNVASDWKFSVKLCCRSFAPSTVSNSSTIIGGLYNEATLDNFNVPLNSSPQFNSNLMPLFCLGVYTVIDFSCTDPDGDSLVYNLDSTFFKFNCGSDSSSSVEYNIPYTYLSFLDTNSPLGFNSATGSLSFTPSSIQSTVYSIRVDEYRNGLKIGSFKRQEELLIHPSPNGISSIEQNQNNLVVYPNPTFNDLNVVLNENKNIIITNLLGETLIEKSSNLGPNEIVDVSNLSKGIYFIRVGTESTKFIKE